VHEPRSNVPSSVDPSITAAAWPPGAESHGSGLPGGEIDPKLDLAARSRMASLRASMFGASAEPARVGRFVVLETLGAGGMGVVHAAYDPRLDRKIALKLVKPEVAAAGTNGEARLLREAQAMARLSHPNVVQIHEVGAWEGRVFIAMELVAGRSLATWLEVQPRGWREVVHMFAEAGRGLAAAHAAGMVHRDFKPENVLVGDDGRVRVTDFGLARGGVSESGAGETWREPGDPLAAIVEGMSVGTAAFAGTPRFMSPEQFLGEPATAASDQFSFCVALYVALHGVHPFVGEDRATLAKAVIAGERREPPRMRVPRKIHKAVVKGLARAPGARFAGMGELLRAIEPRAGWQRVMPVALFAVTGAGAVGVMYEGDPCEDTGALLAGTWDDERMLATQEVFAASSVPSSAALWTTVAVELDQYTDKIRDSYSRSCKAQRRGESTQSLHDLRVVCLRRRLSDVRAVVDELLTGDAAVLQKAPEATIGFDSLGACEDDRTLRLGMDPPPLGDALAVARVQTAIARAHAAELVGHMQESYHQFAAALADSRVLGYEPTIAEALYGYGRLAIYDRRFSVAEAAMLEAQTLALGARHDELVRQLGISLIQTDAMGRGETRAADARLREAEAWLRRGTATELDLAELERTRGIVYATRGEHVAAEAASRRALEIRESVLGSDHLHVAIDRLNHAHRLDSLGRTEEAIEIYHRVLRTMHGSLGGEHSLVADVHYNLGVALLNVASPEALAQAEENLGRARAIVEAQRGPETLELADNYVASARVSQLRKQLGEAESKVSAALAIYDQYPGHPDRAYALGVKGDLLFSSGRLDEAVAVYSEVRAIGLAAWGADSHMVGNADWNLGDLLRAKGDFVAAIRRYKSATRAFEAVFGPESAELIAPMRGRGQAEYADGAGCEAVVTLDGVLALMAAHQVGAVETAETEAMHREARLYCNEANPAPDDGKG
jgi:tetratricopeptide (TPR) repeat protein